MLTAGAMESKRQEEVARLGCAGGSERLVHRRKFEVKTKNHLGNKLNYSFGWSRISRILNASEFRVNGFCSSAMPRPRMP